MHKLNYDLTSKCTNAVLEVFASNGNKVKDFDNLSRELLDPIEEWLESMCINSDDTDNISKNAFLQKVGVESYKIADILDHGQFASVMVDVFGSNDNAPLTISEMLPLVRLSMKHLGKNAVQMQLMTEKRLSSCISKYKDDSNVPSMALLEVVRPDDECRVYRYRLASK